MRARSALSALLALFVLVTASAFPAPARADFNEWASEYSANVANRFLMGLDSLLTFPADPVMSTVQPRSEFDDLPGAVVTRYPVGFCQGALLSAYRATMGAIDLSFAWLTPLVMLSPAPRYMLFPGVENTQY